MDTAWNVGLAPSGSLGIQSTTMKTLLIVVLLAALGLVALITRPSKADFERYLREELVVGADGKTSGGKTIGDVVKDQISSFGERGISLDPAAAFLKDVNYHNYFLWINVDRGGKTLYTGAFSHWWKRDGAESVPAAT